MTISVGAKVINLHEIKPFLHFKTEDSSVSTDIKENTTGLSTGWSEVIRLRIKENGKINVYLKTKYD